MAWGLEGVGVLGFIEVVLVFLFYFLLGVWG